MIENSFYSDLIQQLNRRSTRASLGLLGFRNNALREYLRSIFEQDAGVNGSFLADPVFEATFGWEQANIDFSGLKNNLLNVDLVQSLTNPQRKGIQEDYTFKARQKPYRHQLDAWKALIDATPPRSVLVSSGTGSGKTECFLIPILNDLANEIAQRQNTSLTGVRALFLYPLNALIKSQKDRLVAWSEPFNGKVRFCLYNGDTPTEAKRVWQSEVADRRTLRANPPPILVTNSTMLEYMLVRHEDRPILEQSQGQLRWIVIDEAHSYLGSQAAELTLLLRRVLHAFGCEAGSVHFIATSATLGDSSVETRQRLAEFLADIAGVSVDRVTVIEGKREVPNLDEKLIQTNEPCPDLSELRALSPEARFVVLAKNHKVRSLRINLTQKPDKLTNLCNTFYGHDNSTNRHGMLELLDLCSQSKNEKSEPFLPLRGHLFHRTLNGIWACANANCKGRLNTKLDDEKWAFGALFLERHEYCPHCEAPVFELVQCNECGAEYLSAVEKFQDGKDWLVQSELIDFDEDEFQKELEPLDEDEIDLYEILLNDNSGQIRLITDQSLASITNVGLSSMGKLDFSCNEGNPIHMRVPDFENNQDFLLCAVCNTKHKNPKTSFKSIRLGAPFLLGTAIPTLLERLSPMTGGQEPRPFDGKRLITFTDSRQGTARFSTKLQQESERNYVRSLLYHSVATNVVTVNQNEIDALETQINALEPLVNNAPALRQTLDGLIQQRNKLISPKPAQLTWKEAEDRLLNADDFTRWMLPVFNELTYGTLSEREIAKLCLLREFFIRPKRLFSLEGLGLLQLHYPKLEAAALPAIIKQKGIAIEDWHDLLQVVVDYFLRSSGSAISVEYDIIRWIGYVARPIFVLAAGSPEKLTKPTKKRNWISTASIHAHRNRIIKLLAYKFKLDLENSSHTKQLEEILFAIWQSIKDSGLLTQYEDGFQIKLEEQAVLREVTEAWLCPVTRRLLPITFFGITPYLPNLPVSDEMALCKKFTLPRVPFPFWYGKSKQESHNWLETNQEIRILREFGVWTDINDRIVLHSRFIRAMEHSAQISGSDLTKRENDFKAGQVNLLSCSTTMEMGVDIGGLTAVAMNNVPPHPANYLQRAGRAGRRGETAALSFTLCKSNPHGESVFKNPLWAFTTRLAMPQVALQSEPIVQRHVNALILTIFLSYHVVDGKDKLNTGWFFEAISEDLSPPYKVFSSWCELDALKLPNLTDGLSAITSRTILAGRPPEYLLARCITELNRVSTQWNNDLDCLLEQVEIVKTSNGDSKPEKAIEIQLKRLRGEYLLGVLASLSFLPGYGFPTDVVQLVTTTLDDISDQSEREDNRSKRAGYPSRNLAIAIRDYAPGTDTVLDGRVYRSGGVTMNWQIPVEANAAPEIQNIRWVWRCNSCGSNGIKIIMPTNCPHCGNDKANLTSRRYLQPAGFAVEIRYQPHNDISTPQYIPVLDPLVSLDGSDWIPMPHSAYGRFRHTRQGQIFHHSNGLNGSGFALCLRCGLADSMTGTELPSMLLNHKRLRGGRIDVSETSCPGNNSDWSILKNVSLGVSTQTEIFELQLLDSDGQPLDKVTAYTLAIAMRRALCQLLGIEENEIGTHATSSRNENEHIAYTIYLYDNATGGAGYVSQAALLLPELFRKTVTVLDCSRNCDSACQGCLLTYDTQHHLDDLNRHTAKLLLSDVYLNALDIPHHLKAFGYESHLELEPLILAINREWQRHEINLLRVYLSGDNKNWEPLSWRLRDELIRLNTAEKTIQLIVMESCLAGLGGSQKSELASLVTFVGAELYSTQLIPTPKDSKLPLIIEMGSSDLHISWIASDENALAPSSHWGSGYMGAQYVFCRNKTKIPVQLNSLKKIESTDLYTVPSGFVQLEIGNKFDGASLSFGETAWSLMIKQVPELGVLLNDSLKIREIRYSDRYLRSPLSILLLHNLILGLFNLSVGKATTSLQIQTEKLDYRNGKYPQKINHDWTDGSDRKIAVITWFGESFQEFHWEEKLKYDLPHERRLEVVWENGMLFTVILDQGVGSWKLNPYIKSEFPFQSSVEEQIIKLKKANVMIESYNASYSVNWYVSIKNDKNKAGV